MDIFSRLQPALRKYINLAEIVAKLVLRACRAMFGKCLAFCALADRFSRILSIGCVSLTAVLTLFAVQAIEGKWTWVVRQEDGLSRHIPQLSAEFLPIPIVFLLWARLMEREKPFILSFSPFFTALSVEGFIAALALAEYSDYNNLRQFAVGFGVIAGLFALVPFSECVRRIIRRPRPAIVAVIAGSAACNYYFLMRIMWEQMCGWVLADVFTFLSVFGMNLYADLSPNNFLLESPYFGVQVNPGCNGLEGIFLFNFLLSVMFLIDWELFKTRRILPLYLFGLIYMFFFNVLRITAFFTIGYWAYQPNVWDWVHELQGAPVYLFHSYVGWVFYLIAFEVFANWLYRSTARR